MCFYVQIIIIKSNLYSTRRMYLKYKIYKILYSILCVIAQIIGIKKYMQRRWLDYT